MKKIKFGLLLFLSTLVNLSAAATEKSCNTPKTPQFAVLLDLSEPFDIPSKIAFETLTQKILNSLPSGSKLSIFTIKTNSVDAESPDFSICVPDFESMKGEKYKERALLKFFNNAAPEINKISNTISYAQKSPIIENIFKISHSTFLKSTTKSNQTLIVISDLIQYSDLTNFYTTQPSYTNFISNKNSASWLPKLNNVNIQLILINSESSKKVDLKKIRSFWLDYSKNNFIPCGFSGLNEAAVSFKNDCTKN
jgi:hypothetical protein